MPKIVDIDKKREEIAKKSIDLVLQKGFCNLTVSQVASKAKIAKGSIYNYFNSKEDIIYEIIKVEYSEYDKEVEKNIKKAKTTKDKVLALFQLCISNKQKDIKRRQLYKEFVSICLNQAECSMIDFKKSIRYRYIDWLKNILDEGVKKNEFRTDIVKFADGLFVMAEGVILLADYDATILINCINEIFNIMKINEEE